MNIFCYCRHLKEAMWRFCPIWIQLLFLFGYVVRITVFDYQINGIVFSF
jgi:hypothetical protein